MGNSGGFRITKIEHIKENWESLREKLIQVTGEYLGSADKWNEGSFLELYDSCKKLPKKLSTRASFEDIAGLLSIFEGQECPFIFEDILYTGEGAYVSDEIGILSFSIECTIKESIGVKTWT
jgi:hypothetical protein